MISVLRKLLKCFYLDLLDNVINVYASPIYITFPIIFLAIFGCFFLHFFHFLFFLTSSFVYPIGYNTDGKHADFDQTALKSSL